MSTMTEYYDRGWVHGVKSGSGTGPGSEPGPGTSIWKWLLPALIIAALVAVGVFFFRPKPQWRNAVVYIEVTTPDGNKVSGTGTIIRPDGYILTNKHVAFPKGVHGSKYEVYLHSGESNVQKFDSASVEAEGQGDPDNDISYDWAVLKISSSQPLAYIPIGRSDTVNLEDHIQSIGYPFEIHVSDKGPDIECEDGTIKRLQKSDQGATEVLIHNAQLMPGNSGGPVLDQKGDLIGMNTAFARAPEGDGKGNPILGPDGKAISIGGQDNLAIASQELGTALKYAKDDPYR